RGLDGERRLFGGDRLDPASGWYPMAIDGASCTICHTIADDPTLGTAAGFSGGYVIDESRRIFGQYDDPFTMMMQRQVDYTPTGSRHISSSELCATCHELRTPFVDAAGNLVPPSEAEYFPEQAPYSEWGHSAFREGGTKEKSCADCHLATLDGVRIANRPPWLTARQGFARHLIVGSNTFLQTLVRDNRAALGAPAANYDGAIAATRALLREGAAVTVEKPLLAGSTLSFDVVAVNKGGHKLPTSYPSRRAFLTVTVTDATGIVVFSSGAVGDDGAVAGDDGATDPAAYEPHHDLIVEAGQVQIYEPVMGNSDREVTHTLLRAARYLKDNRLLPEGFDKRTAPAAAQVVGGALADDDFTGGSDRVTYRLAVAGAAPYTIRVALNYQTLSQPFARDLAVDAADPVVAQGVSSIAGGGSRTETLAEA
ncbi:MAG: hypothetical protein HQK87_11960, partial [Nitrospinae bacterium]|nr:hypothetical protein [Nitrospinota bacterium]